MKSLLPIILSLFLGAAPRALASVNVTVNGSTYVIPQTNEKGWGTNVTSWIQGISANTLQPTGGTFTLTADANFGSSFGLIGLLKSTSSNIAGTGVVRLNNNADAVSWRNAANNADLALLVNGSNQLTFNSVVIPTTTSANFQDSTTTIYNNSDSTKIFKFQASGITTGNTRVYTVPDATTNLVGAASTLTNHGVALGAGAAALGVTAAGSTGQILQSNGASADPTYSTPTYPSASGSAGQILRADGTNNVYSTNTFPNTAAAGSILNASSANVFAATVTPTLGLAGTVTGTLSLSGITSGSITIQPQSAAGTWNFNLPITAGNAGQVLTSQGGVSSAMTWTSPFTNPMTTTGDIVYSADNSGTPARLGGSAGYLKSTGAAAPTWATFTAHTVTTKTSTGSTTGYRFLVSGITTAPTNGATYTNNGNTYTVVVTDSGKANIWTTQAAAPQASGTLTKSAGTGDATISFSSNTPLATYSSPATAKALFVRLVGSGGGGGGTAGASNGGAAGGGGGGGYVEKLITSPGATFYYEIGAAGGAGGAGNNAGVAGSKSSFVSSDGTILLVGGGGTGGSGSGSGCTGPVFTTAGVGGGSASGGDLNIGGGYGFPGTCLGAGQTLSGCGGGTPFGTCQAAAQGTQAGFAGVGYGSGGSGGSTSSGGAAQAGGAGTTGLIDILELYNGN